jgi:hypothetical protein
VSGITVEFTGIKSKKERSYLTWSHLTPQLLHPFHSIQFQMTAVPFSKRGGASTSRGCGVSAPTPLPEVGYPPTPWSSACAEAISRPLFTSGLRWGGGISDRGLWPQEIVLAKWFFSISLSFSLALSLSIFLFLYLSRSFLFSLSPYVYPSGIRSHDQSPQAKTIPLVAKMIDNFEVWQCLAMLYLPVVF